MKAQLNQVHHTSKEVAKALEHLSSVIWMVVQSEGAASALDIQDDNDRGKVALMGYKAPQKGGSAGSARPKTSGGRASASNPQTPEDLGSGGAGPVISVDQRCLSCSGHAQTVLSGFKMACLEYAPGPVSFAKRVWHRADLLDWRNKLLQQAHESLQSGPVELQDALASAGAVAGPPRAQSAPSKAGASIGKSVGPPATEENRAGEHLDSKVTSKGVVMRMPPLSSRTMTAR